MRHARSLGFEGLESRRLLSRAHLAAVHAHARVHAHPAAAAVSVPLVLDGTLAVDNRAATVTSTNGFGGETISSPVAGVLNGLGKVHGQWNEEIGSFATALGPNSLVLQNRQGTFTIEFGAVSRSQAHRTASGAVINPIAQKVTISSGAYAKSKEVGTIVLTTNRALSLVESMTLATTSTTP